MNSAKSLRLMSVIGKVLQPWKNLLETRPCINQRALSSIVPKAHAETANQHEESAEPQEDSLFKTIEVEVRSGDPAVLKSYEWFATTAAKHLGITIGECFAPPRARHDRLTLLKSVHIYKKHRVQYEIRTYFRHMKFHKLTGSTADTFLEYIQRNLPEGVAMKVTKTALERMPQPIKALQAAALSSQSSPSPS